MLSLFGSNNVEPGLHESIEDRFSPPPLLAFQEELTGGKHPAARRTAQWLSANKWSDVEIGSGVMVNLDRWIERVKRITDQILSNDAAEVHAVSRLLLEFVIGDLDNAASIEERGLLSLYEEDPDTAWDLIKFFEESGRRPVKDNPDLELLDEAVRVILVTLMERTPRGWDAVGPAMNGEGKTSR